MKTITFDGRIGANGAEVRTTKGGKPYVRFSVANNSFANGAEKTEWFDVTSYDEYIINNRVKYLTKGTYVIVTGNPNIEVNVRDGKIWLNQYITASTIDTPSFKKKEDEATTNTVSETVASTFTGGTESQRFSPTPEPMPETTPEPATVPSYANSVAGNSSTMAYNSDEIDNDDMPF